MKLNIRQHPTYQNVYITPEGRVFQELNVVQRKDGYGLVSIRTHAHPIRVLQHVLVLEAYKGLRPSSQHETRHLNGDPHDNQPDNLEWGTTKENAADAIRHGTSVRNKSKKLTEKDVCEIKQRLAAGESGAAIAAYFQVGQVAISTIKKGKTWKHVRWTTS
jgi:hypothetical protein